MPRYRRYFERHYWVFLTLVTGNRRPWLRPAGNKKLVLDSMRELKQRHHYRHLAHVILDDHLHWMLIAGPTASVPQLVSRLKQTVNFKRHRRGQPWNGLWQRRYYDHILRDDEDFRRHLDYIHYNPVKHGYVAMACQYRWSSFHAWAARGTYTKCWGTAEPKKISGMELE